MSTNLRGLVSAVLASLVLHSCGTGETPRPDAQTPDLRVSADVKSTLLESPYVHVSEREGRSFMAGGWRRTGSRSTRGLFVSRADGSRSPAWTLRIATRSAAITCLAPRRDGGCVVTGWFSGSLVVEHETAYRVAASGLAEMFLLAIAPDGQPQWMVASATAGDHPYTTGDVVATRRDGSCVVIGNAHGHTAFDGTHLDRVPVEADEQERGFLARYTAGGHLDWVRELPGRIDVDRGAAIATTECDGFLIVGSTHKARGCFIARCDDEGRVRWVRRTSGDGSVAAMAAAITASGSCVVTGWFMREVAFPTEGGSRDIRARGTMDLFVACYAPAGELRWLRRAGGDGDAYAQGQVITEGADETLEVRGVFGGTIRFDGLRGRDAPVHAQEVDDQLVARLDSKGQIVALTRRTGDH